MSEPMVFGNVPVGRRLDANRGDGYADGVFGIVSRFPRATKRRSASTQHARTSARFPTSAWTVPSTLGVIVETGETFELVRSYFNIIDPAESGATAFVVSDGNLLGLRPAGTEEEVKSVFVGNLTNGATA